MATNQNSIEKPNELPRNNNSGEIRTKPQQKTRGRKRGPETVQPKEKKQPMRGLGVARLEQLRMEEEQKKMILAQGGMVVGYPTYGGGPNMPYGFGPGQFMFHPVYPPCGFVDTSTHEPSSIPNPQMRNAVHNGRDTSAKRQRIDGDENVTGGEFPSHAMAPAPPPMNGYDHTGSMEENPRNGTGVEKPYDFFPVKGGNESVSSVSTSGGDCSPNESTIDLTLKL